eukprot:gene18368-18637_t
MSRSFGLFGLACLIVSAPAMAQSLPPIAMADQFRAAAEGRAVFVAVAKTTIEPEIDLGRVISDAAYGGGLLGALINESKDHKRQDLAGIAQTQADADIAPLQKAIADLDLGKLAVQSAQSALVQPAWFQAGTVTALASSGDAAPAMLAKTATTAQFGLVAYHFLLSPDCTQLKVIADVVVYQGDPAHKADAAKPPVVRFQQRIASIAELRKRSYVHAENVAQWSDDNGKLARQAIDGALARLAHAVPFALNQTVADIDALTQAKAGKVFSAGFYGAPVPLPAMAAGEIALWHRGIIDVTDVP